MGDKQRPFALAMSSNRLIPSGTQVAMMAGFCMARSSAEAHGMALNMALARWPIKDGYSQHGASWMEMSKEHSEMAAASFAPKAKRRRFPKKPASHG